MFTEILCVLKKASASILFKVNIMIFAGVLGFPTLVFAGDTSENPKLITGAVDLFNAMTTWLLILIPVGAGAVLGYHAFLKTMSDDQAVIAEKNKQMKNVLVSGAIAMTASGLVKIVLAFFE